VQRHGRRPSPGVCHACEDDGTNRITGAGDVLRLILTPLADRLPSVARVRDCSGCQARQEALNRLVAIRWGHHADRP